MSGDDEQLQPVANLLLMPAGLAAAAADHRDDGLKKVDIVTHCITIAQQETRMPTKAPIHGSKPKSERKSEVRGSAHERGYGARWQRARLAHLTQEPLCRACLTTGHTTAATVVDHIRPHRGDLDLFWNAANWQSLCARCHNTKTAKGQ